MKIKITHNESEFSKECQGLIGGTFPNASASTRKLNPHLFGDAATQPESGQTGRDPSAIAVKTPRVAKRIRQSSKPLLNKLESEFYETLKNEYPNYPPVRPQAVRLKIGNGSWYKGDFFVASWPQEDGPSMPTVWECKGPKEMKNIARGIVVLKSAAHQWPEIAFYLVWRENGQWKEQRVMA